MKQLSSHSSVWFFGLLLWLSGCSAGESALKNGNYDSAVLSAVGRLRQKPEHATAQKVLSQAFRAAYEQRQNAILRLSRSAEPFRWERVLPEYQKLQKLGDAINACPTCPERVSGFPLDFRDRLGEVRELAAADRYRAAEEAFAYRETDRLAAREAVLQFQKASQWVPNYRDADGRAADALYFAAFRLVIEPMQPSREISGSEYDELQRDIFRNLDQSGPPSQFVRYYMPGVTPEPGRMPNHVIQSFVANYVSRRESITSASATVESSQKYKVGTKKINDSTVVDVMETVKGTLTTHRITVVARLDLRIRALDPGAERVAWEDELTEVEEWADEWETFSGDQRALNGKSLKTRSLLVPSTWQLYSNLSSSMASSVSRKLRYMYRDH